MTTDTRELCQDAENLFSNKEYGEVITLLTDKAIESTLTNDNDMTAALYLLRGNARYENSDYDNAIEDYSKAIAIKPNYDLAYYNRASTLGAKKEEYTRSIDDYTKAIEFNKDNPDYYAARGTDFKAKKEYVKAIDDYNRAIEIDPNFASPYYNIGLVKKETNKLEEAKKYFTDYLNIVTIKNDTSSKYARCYVEDINERLADEELSKIASLIDLIKIELRFNENCVTHYTSLSTLTRIMDENVKFQISEGHFLNDPSEGTVFFDFLKWKTSESTEEKFSENFAPKPFIGSFVPGGKYDDLNMWRFYGKEGDLEAKGCSITIRAHKFIDNINYFLTDENDYAKYESDINFYRVVYLDTNAEIVDQGQDNNSELKRLMEKLKEEVISYSATHNDKTILEKRLNAIAFLFKCDAYKYENEVRIIVKGVEFKKKIMMGRAFPRVYIELAPIKSVVKQITFGPKVDSINDWKAVFYYTYEGGTPIITSSQIPYR